jgi:hypothetical protein
MLDGIKALSDRRPPERIHYRQLSADEYRRAIDAIGEGDADLLCWWLAFSQCAPIHPRRYEWMMTKMAAAGIEWAESS